MRFTARAGYEVEIETKEGFVSPKEMVSRIHKLKSDIHEATGKMPTVLRVVVGCEKEVSIDREKEPLSKKDFELIEEEAVKHFKPIGEIEPKLIEVKYKV